MKITFIKSLVFVFLIFIQPPLFASDDPINNLVKVTSENKQQCVEYYTYQGSLYCSTKPLSPNTGDPNIQKYETQTVVFDDRPWQAAWGQKKDTNITVEYVPMGDDINHWNELVTSQFFPGLQNKVTPKDFAQSEIDGLKSMGFDPITNIINDDPDSFLFEFRIESPAEQAQDEIQKVTLGQNGIYVLHYAIKKKDMGQKAREEWIRNFSRSGIK